MEKLKELIEEEIKKVEEKGLEMGKLEQLETLVDIHKAISNEEYWKNKEETAMRYGNYGEYNEGYEGYGRRRRDSRGRYMEGRYNERGTTDGRDRMRGNYGHYMPYPEMYMDRMMDGMEGYMEGREQYNRGNYNGKDQSVESLEKMLEGTQAFLGDILKDPEQKETHEVIKHYIREFQGLL